MNIMDEAQIRSAPFINTERLYDDVGNLLVLAPHPDDESLGCGGLIALLREAGSSVSVIFVTSGSASHTSKTHPPNTLSKVRELEAIKACADLGVHLSNLHFLRAPDSKLDGLSKKVHAQIVRKISDIIEEGEYTAIALPWRRDPHPDHRVVNRLGEMALSKTDSNLTKFEFPIWLWKNGKKADWPLDGETVAYKLNIDSVFEKKWLAIERHCTQLGKVIFDDPNGFELTEELLQPFKHSIEYFFITKRRLNTLNADYFEKLYAENTDPWNFRHSEYELQKYHRCIQVLGQNFFASALELGCSIGIQSYLLSKICRYLMAVDISEVAIEEAKQHCAEASNIEFKTMNLAHTFPKGKFNLITCCEMGYYFTKEDLRALFVNIDSALLSGGTFLLVHWTPFVPDYPMSGDDVHDSFLKFAAKAGNYRKVVHERENRYRLEVWQKCFDDLDR